MSILWVYFEKADAWVGGSDVFNRRLNYQDFQFAVIMFTTSYRHEHSTETDLWKGYQLFDIDANGYITFLDLSRFCSRFVDQQFADNFMKTTDTKQQIIFLSTAYTLRKRTIINYSNILHQRL
jgi:Ca2+-binding EF-hand superfamily protein